MQGAAVNRKRVVWRWIKRVLYSLLGLGVVVATALGVLWT